MKSLFDSTSFECSKIVTHRYSTSFSLGTLMLAPTIRKHIYSIYGYVRIADEIVDSFHEYNKEYLLESFIEDTWRSIDQGISLNPILNSFQQTVNTYGIDKEVIEAFLKSMRTDLSVQIHDEQSYKEYIYGSAEVVGLMCLRVFVEGNESLYHKLKSSALALGSAFQKVNFLRDFNHDKLSLGRTYFPELKLNHQFNDTTKAQIEIDIEKDFKLAYEGILRLPKSSQLGVYVAYIYYFQLFQKIKNLRAVHLCSQRVRIPNTQKLLLLTSSYIKHTLSII